MSQKEEFSEKHLKQVMEKWDTEPVPPAEDVNGSRGILDQIKENPFITSKENSTLTIEKLKDFLDEWYKTDHSKEYIEIQTILRIEEDGQ